jgi:hypothetical protein
MAANFRATYLNDHLAGSITAIELLEYLSSMCSSTDANAAGFATDLKNEIAEDRQELEQLMQRLGIAQSVPRKTSAWVAEKFLQLKLKIEDVKCGSLRLLEVTEAVSVGIEGKKLLWVALAAAAEIAPELTGLDYARLIRRAEDQRVRVETIRRDAAKQCLAEIPEQ